MIIGHEGYAAARDVALSVLANLKAEIGDLSRITGWVRVFAMVNSDPGYTEQLWKQMQAL